MTDQLPQPTLDLARARGELDRHGYCVVRDALSPDVCSELRERIVEQAAGERAAGLGADDLPPEHYVGGSGRGEGNNRRVWTLVNKGEIFLRLLTHPDVNPLIGQVLGTPFLLSSIQANFVSPGDHALPLHSDQGYVPRPWPPYAMTASVIWMIDEFTVHNGATAVVPGSHVEPHERDTAAVLSRARLIRRGGIPVVGPSGSALVFDGRIVHGTGINSTDRPRIGVLTYFCRPFVRPQENFTLSVRPDVLHGLPDDVTALLGFQVWKTLGSVEGVCAEGATVTRPATAVGALNRAGRPVAAPDLAVRG